MAGAELYYEDVEFGDDIGPVERVVTDDEVKEFLSVRQPHVGPSRFTDAEHARSEGLPGAIVPGAFNMAIMSQLITDWSPSVTLRKLDVVFRQVVPHNKPLKIQGIVTDKNIIDGEAQLECDVYMENEEGTRLLIGKATVVLPSRELLE